MKTLFVLVALLTSTTSFAMGKAPSQDAPARPPITLEPGVYHAVMNEDPKACSFLVRPSAGGNAILVTPVTHHQSAFACPQAGKISRYELALTKDGQWDFLDRSSGLTLVQSAPTRYATARYSGAPTVFERVADEPIRARHFAYTELMGWWFEPGDLCPMTSRASLRCDELTEELIVSEDVCEKGVKNAVLTATRRCQSAGYETCEVASLETLIYLKTPSHLAKYRSGCEAAVVVDGS
ncbi:MAG: hypothetical protein NDJ90_11760 [Oligoflexia bacterium]|nr:hypothetical protein [Oligoflexia bacterium]